MLSIEADTCKLHNELKLGNERMKIIIPIILEMAQVSNIGRSLKEKMVWTKIRVQFHIGISKII